jgi:hypothetical protein
VTLLFEVGPDFDRHPAFARALAMQIPDENERIKAISANTSDEDWAAARAVSDRSAWSRLVDAAR